ncbi:hypothetical protein DICPUDRAFT_83890 [Dictyostelium purpureum]|uniref:Uncharacterized protein n=1 Tax=Dictyostelium purpureum TaxID=5786 RepID=F1A0Y1_DICPU|nr:uncharacterized protein DICPUDRAFT_83890 [Dictyostelium purpureum]EGC30147.1 hypothetical protein DICPUDRAFT_83890 [Dictyostelium purpureum]|eukprot:XP_003293330.1 hypothetical protein DICPUDRAFT_83890 [Dictyostelium purpureum]
MKLTPQKIVDLLKDMIIQTFYARGENKSFFNEGVTTAEKMIKKFKLTQLIQPTTLVVNYFTVHQQQEDEQEQLVIQNDQQQEVDQQHLEQNEEQQKQVNQQHLEKNEDQQQEFDEKNLENNEEEQLHLSLTLEHHPIDSDEEFNYKYRCYQDPNSPPATPKSPSQKQEPDEISQQQIEENEKEESQIGEMTLSQQIEANNFQEFLKNHKEPEPIVLGLTLEHHPIDSDEEFNYKYKCYQDPDSPGNQQQEENQAEESNQENSHPLLNQDQMDQYASSDNDDENQNQNLRLSLTLEHHPIDSDDDYDYNWKCYQDPNSPSSTPKSPAQDQEEQEENDQNQVDSPEQEKQVEELTLSQQIEEKNFQEFLKNHQEPEPIVLGLTLEQHSIDSEEEFNYNYISYQIPNISPIASSPVINQQENYIAEETDQNEIQENHDQQNEAEHLTKQTNQKVEEDQQL